MTMDSVNRETAENKKIVIYLVRHAESLCNVSMGWDQREDPTATELTPLGRKQAERLGEHLAHVKFDHAQASDYKRALHTAQIILKCQKGDAHVPLEIKICKELREMDLGKMSNSSYIEILGHYMKHNKSLQEWVLPDGESIHDAGERMLHHFEQTCAMLLDSSDETNLKPEINLLIVGHSMAILAFLNFLTHDKTHPHSMLNWNGNADIKIIKNCCYYKFEVSKAAGKNDNSPTSIMPLQINVIEKYASSHLTPKVEDEEILNVSTWDRSYLHGDVKKIRETIELSERGKEVINCVQQ